MADDAIVTCPNENLERISDDKKKGGRFRRLLLEYCEISTIQGLSYVIKDISIFERLWWILVLLSCMTGCSIMIYQVIDKWLTTPVLVSLATQETPIYDIPFPAVTICPETKLRRDCMYYDEVLISENFGSSNNTSFSRYSDYMLPLCGSSDFEHKFRDRVKNSTKNLDDYATFLRECAAVYSESNFYCEWLGNYVDCEKIFTPILTEEGMCYSFNMFDVRDIYSDANQMDYYEPGERNLDWYPGQGFPEHKLEDTFPRRVFLNGEKNSLFVVVLTSKSDVYYACRQFAIQGIRVSLHIPATIPRPSQVFFSVGLDRLTSVAVKPTLMRTTESVENYSPHERDCYFEQEKKLKFFKIYTQGNCNFECLTNHTINRCGCADFYMPRDNETRICNMTMRSCLTRAKVNYPQTILWERLRLSKGKISATDCDCLPLCSDLSYNSEIATGNWNWNDPDEVKMDEDRDLLNQFYSSGVKIYFKDTFFLPTEKSELYGFSDFISNIGGILGLFTGFTLFSVAEILYFISIKLIANYRRHGHLCGEAIK